tara:strand:- start:264 stop:377 length:114 start_codon:yes stop_codon:yes gene_type:complete
VVCLELIDDDPHEDVAQEEHSEDNEEHVVDLGRRVRG